MPLLLSSSLILPTSHNNQICVHDSGYHRKTHSNLKCISTHFVITQNLFPADRSLIVNLKNKPLRRFRPMVVKCTNSNFEFVDSKSGVTEEWSYQEDEGIDNIDSPWEGAVVYQRNASISHVEYCTTLERLGLEEYSTKVSRSRASLMGLRVTKAVKDYPLGTPVMVSLDITRRKQKLRLDGIIRTVLTLSCNRYLFLVFCYLYYIYACLSSYIFVNLMYDVPKQTHMLIQHVRCFANFTNTAC